MASMGVDEGGVATADWELLVASSSVPGGMEAEGGCSEFWWDGVGIVRCRIECMKPLLTISVIRSK